MGQTSIYALPFPEQSDPADVPTDMRELAEKVELVADGLDDRLDVLDAGIGNALNHGCRVWRNAAHPLSANSDNRIYFDSEDWDPSNSYTEGGGFIAPATGLYAWAASLALLSSTAGVRAALKLYVGEAMRDSTSDLTVGNIGVFSLAGSGFVRLNAANVVTVRLFTSVATSLDTSAVPQARCWMELARLA